MLDLLMSYSHSGSYGSRDMATQPIKSDRPERGQPGDFRASTDPTWRILAKEAAEEEDPEKLMQIVKALNVALEEEEAKKKKSA